MRTDKRSEIGAAAGTVLPVALVALAAILAIQGLTALGVSSIATVRQRQADRTAEHARSLEFTLGQLRQATVTLAPENPRLKLLIYQAESTARGLADSGREAARQSDRLQARATLAIGMIAELFLLATLGAVLLARRRSARAEEAEAPPMRIVTPPPAGPPPTTTPTPPSDEPAEMRKAA